ncbi:hypothetical protein AB0M39_09265 [Streptomyces sp. NPDC051907]|uniref:hypothetical protein n=1 Tax=Streptomyces sp. NPDC051907 TaxID=3155284 RepID=UPI00341F86EF
MNRRRERGWGRATLASIAAMCAVAALPGQSWAAAEHPYAFDSEAKPVQGAAVNSDGPTLEAGSVYKDTIKPGEKRYYRIDLDAKASAYVSAVAVPKLGTKVAYGDKLAVSIEDRSGVKCGDDDAMFRTGAFARPVAAYADRTIDKSSSSCQESGAYYVLLQRTSQATSTPEPWEVEIRFASEPGLTESAPTAPPENWPSASPAAPAGGPQKRAGGAGFAEATSLKQGEWQDEIVPGQTLFYRVPVDWGQQIFASADLGSSTATDSSKSVSNALVLSLHNPARGHVDEEAGVIYDGKQKSVALEPLPPVAYENRYDSAGSDAAMRFAGWYYLSVTLSPEIADAYGKQALPLTLRVNVDGKPKPAPAYAGPAGEFEVSDDDKKAADTGKSASAAADTSTMKLVGAAGIGAGTVLVLGLGAWMLLARRRTPEPAAPGGYPAPMPGQPGLGQPMPGQFGQPPVQGHGISGPYGQAPGPYGQPPAQ